MYRKAPVLFGLCVIASGILASSRCAAAQGDIVTIQIDAVAINQDPRLVKPVSLQARSMPLKAVLDSMAAQTGVAISIDDLDPASGYILFANYEKVPVGTIMNALYGLFSINRGEWAWTRLGKPGAYSYRFHETPWAKNRTDIYNGMLKGLLEHYLEVMRKLAPMKMAERKLHRDELQKALLLDDPGELEAYIKDELFWNEAKFYFGALTRDQQDAVLAGTTVSVSLKTLPPDVYDLYHQYYLVYHSSYTAPGAATVEFPEPGTVWFYRSNQGRESAQVAPLIIVGSSSGGWSWLGTGFLEFGIRNAIKRAWMLQGDNVSDPASRRIVAEVTDSDEIRKEKETAAAFALRFQSAFHDEASARIAASRPAGLYLGPRLEQLSAGSSTPVLAVIAPTDLNWFKSPVGKPIQDFLDQVEAKGYKRWYYKWRGGVLLVSHPYWFIESIPAIPYALLSTLHPDSAGQAPLAQWTKLMSSISDSQAAWLATTYNINEMIRLRSCLLLIANEPDIMRSDGVSADDSAVHYLQPVSLVPPNFQPSDTGRRVRIVMLSTEAPTPATAALQVEIYDATRNEWTRSGIVPLPVYHDPAHRVPPAHVN